MTPLWVSELISAKSKGRHVAIEGNLIAFGIVLAYYYNIGMSYTTGPAQEHQLFPNVLSL